MHPSEKSPDNQAPTIIKVFVSSSPEDDRDGMVTELLARVASDLEPSRDSGAAPSAEAQTRIEFIGRQEVAGAGLGASVPANADVVLAIVSPAYFADPACRAQWEQFRAIEAARNCAGEAIVPLVIEDSRHIVASDASWWHELQSRGCLELGSIWARGPVGVQAGQGDGHIERICRSMVCRFNLCKCIKAVQQCDDADPLAIRELGRALLRAGHAACDPMWSRYREVTRAYVKRAAAICDRLNAMVLVLDPDVRFQLGILCHQLGMASFAESTESVSYLRRALEIFSSLEPNRSKDYGPEYYLASTLHALGCCYAQENRDLALDCLRASLKWSGDLVALYADDHWLGQMHLETILCLGNVQVEHHQTEDAMATFSQAIELSGKFRPSEWYRGYLDRALWSLSEIHVAAGRLDDARPIFDRLIGVLTSDLRQSPDSIHAARSLAGRLSEIASILHARGQQDEAMALFQQALSVLDACAGTHAGDPQVLGLMASVRRHLSRALRDRNESARAMAMGREALALSEKICENEPMGVDDVVHSLELLAELEAREGQLDEARRHLVRAVAVCEEAARELPDEGYAVRLLATWQGVLGEFDARNPGSEMA